MNRYESQQLTMYTARPFENCNTFQKVVTEWSVWQEQSLPPESLPYVMSWCLKKTKISEPIIATQYICKVPFLKSSIWRGTGIISFIHTLMDNRFKNLIVHKILCSWSPPTLLFQLFISNVSVCVVSFRISPQTFVRFSTLFKEKYMASMSRQNWG